MNYISCVSSLFSGHGKNGQSLGMKLMVTFGLPLNAGFLQGKQTPAVL